MAIVLLVCIGSFGGGLIWWQTDVARLRTEGIETLADTGGKATQSKRSGTIRTSLQFTDRNGISHKVTHEGRQQIYLSPKVAIVYDPQNPEYFVLKSELKEVIYPTGWQVLLMLIGVAFGAIIVLFLAALFEY